MRSRHPRVLFRGGAVLRAWRRPRVWPVGGSIPIRRASDNIAATQRSTATSSSRAPAQWSSKTSRYLLGGKFPMISHHGFLSPFKFNFPKHGCAKMYLCMRLLHISRIYFLQINIDAIFVQLQDLKQRYIHFILALEIFRIALVIFASLSRLLKNVTWRIATVTNLRRYIFQCLLESYQPDYLYRGRY